MCGICGFNRNNPELIQRMTDVLEHRGPDQEGHYCDEAWSLGHRRLSIVDLTEHGRQPMANEDGRIQVVFNGEIYNCMEVRAELEAKGHIFHGHSDTEIIPHAYEEWGIEAAHRFQGMFAIAIWDRNERVLYLIRDRIGIKPLYYRAAGGAFAFASEIKAILEDPEVPRELNRQALYAYLGYEFVPAPDTMFAGINKLPAGHWAEIREGQEPKIQPYWDLEFPEPNPALTWDEAVERQRELIEDAVRCRLMSDVPLAAFLSGGLDSSAIVAMMRKHVPGRLRTFTIGYPDKSFSELDYAKIVADKFETDHQVLMIEGLTLDRVDKSLWHLDEPMTDLSTIPLMLLCQQAREHVTVCLSGEGGDEVFAGYDRFRASRLNRYYQVVPGFLRRGVVAGIAERLADRPQKKGAVNMFKRFIQGGLLPEEAGHLRWQYFGSADQDAQLFSAAFKGDVTMDPFGPLRPYARRNPGRDVINREVYMDLRFMMVDGVLMKVDKMSMASSLEIRVPLLDHRLVEYMAGVPGNWKLKNLQTKAVFRGALKGILPDEITFRGKQGYSLPVKNLLRDELKDELTTLLHESPVIRENMNMDFVEQLLSEHMSRTQNHNHVLWGLMNTALWHRRFFE